MADEQKFDARLVEGVAYFEQMLQLMPEDRVTLEFLVVAYEQLGRKEDAQRTLVSLAKILVKERDIAALEGLLPRLEASEAPEAKMLVLKIRTLVAPAPDLTPEAPQALTPEEQAASASREAITAELALVGQLVEIGLLSADQANALRAQIEVSPTDGRIFLISALQILEKENPPLCERCVAALADKFGAPPIPLAAFDLPRDLIAKFSSATMRIRGVVPFATLGKVALVALLNPADERLRAEFSEVMPCRFYLADPSAVESALGKAFAEGEVKS